MLQLLPMTKRIFWGLFNLIFPAECSLCPNPLETMRQRYICSDCLNKIKPIELPICEKCGKPLSPSFNLVQHPLCRQCRTMRRYFTSARAVGTYENVLKKAIWLFKYEGKTGLQETLGSLMVDRIRCLGWNEGIDIIVPVPLHKTKLKSRGYNQSDILAAFMSKKLGIPVSRNNLKRIKATTTQASLKRSQRIKNIHNAFSIKQPEKFSGKRILLIDDVFTTGATSNECSRILKQASSSGIFVLTLARGV
ncbi:ComF family protein [Candidatus Desantisbacteria bacterium]|nr:ComF family protein [Candidatus Desantisbacteria bacterium]